MDIYIVVNPKGGKEGDLTFIVEAYTSQEDAEKAIIGYPHCTVISCPLHFN